MITKYLQSFLSIFISSVVSFKDGMSSFRSVISTALRGAAARNTAKSSSMNRAKVPSQLHSYHRKRYVSARSKTCLAVASYSQVSSLAMTRNPRISNVQMFPSYRNHRSAIVAAGARALGSPTCFERTTIATSSRESKSRRSTTAFHHLIIVGIRVPLKVTAYTIRCVDKAGGFDNYILNTKVSDGYLPPGSSTYLSFCTMITRLNYAVLHDAGLRNTARQIGFGERACAKG
jgi:hypothetical protein